MKHEKTIQASLESIPEITGWVDQLLAMADCTVKARRQIDVALDEILSNIARYAYPDAEGSMTVEIDLDEETGMLSLTFRDEGVPFDPLAKEEPDVTLGVRERAVGGLGIFLVKKMMDEVIYRREGKENILRLYKKVK